MKYLPTVNLWDAAMHAAITSGQLKLQRGQWVQCGAGKKSRYVGTKKSGSLWVAHWQGTTASSNQRFKALCAAF